MLNLSSAHLRQMRASPPTKRLVWVDIGGGTGYNIEAMSEFMPLEDFDAIYLVDLCEPLCAVARARVLRRGWKNVHVICADASSFELPEPGWTAEGGQKGSVSFVTLSYSLSMVRRVPDHLRVMNHTLSFYSSDTQLLPCRRPH
jgi:betaine lipid synthase